MQARAAGHYWAVRRFRGRVAGGIQALRAQGRCRESRRWYVSRNGNQSVTSPKKQTGEITMRLGVLFLCSGCARPRAPMRCRSSTRASSRRRRRGLEDLRDLGGIQRTGAGARRSRLRIGGTIGRGTAATAARQCGDDREHDSRLRAAEDDGHAISEDSGFVPVQERLEEPHGLSSPSLPLRAARRSYAPRALASVPTKSPSRCGVSSKQESSVIVGVPPVISRAGARHERVACRSRRPVGRFGVDISVKPCCTASCWPLRRRRR